METMDRYISEQRRRNMQAIKNKDTQIEIQLRKELWKRGLRYRKNVKTVFGHPDIVFIGKKVAVFCDSEFWHGYDWENRKKDFHTRKEFWIQKIERNMARDKEVNEKLRMEALDLNANQTEELLKPFLASGEIKEAYCGNHVRYTKNTSGIEAISCNQEERVLRLVEDRETITNAIVKDFLSISSVSANTLLSGMVKKGVLRRKARGVYVKISK